MSVAGAEVGPEEKWTERPGSQDHSQGRTPRGEGGGAATPPAASESRLPESSAESLWIPTDELVCWLVSSVG